MKSNIKIKILTTMIIFSGPIYANNGIGTEESTMTGLFQNGMLTTSTSVPDYACYRIPAMVNLANGELLAIAEGREFSCSDHDANTDLVMRKRDVNGNWGDVSILASHGGKVTRNPAPVVDDNGVVHVVYNVNYDSLNPSSQAAILEGSIKQNNNRYRASVEYIQSTDNGATWSSSVNIDSQVHPFRANDDYASGLWSWYAMTPGHAVKLNNGNLFFPANHVESAHELGGTSDVRNYSHGITLNPTTGVFTRNDTVGADTNEVIAVQLDNDWLYMNMRNYHHGSGIGYVRAVSFSDDLAATWMGSQYSYQPVSGDFWPNVGYDSALIDPVVQASAIRYSSERDATGVSRLLFSNPASTGSRTDGTIRVSYDEGKTWRHSYKYWDHLSMYSDLVITDTNDIGIAFERSSGAGDTSFSANSINEGIYFIETNLEKITGSLDAYIETVSADLYTGGSNPATTPITVPHSTVLDPSTNDLSFTLIFTLSATATYNTQFLARKGNHFSSEAGWGLFIESGKIKFRANQSSQRYGVEADIGTLLDDRTVKHTVSAVFDRDSIFGMRIILDGIELPVTSLYGALPIASSIATSNDLVIAGSDGIATLDGIVYGYRVYNNDLKIETLSAYSESATKDYDYSSFFSNTFSSFFN